MRIYLRIYPGMSDKDLRWPFIRLVTISISNRNIPNERRAITNQSWINTPSYHLYSWSKAFNFNHGDLSDAGLFLGYQMVVKCSVDN